MIIIYILLAIIVVALLVFVGIYNSFVSLRNRTDESWADIDVQLKRRYDLIPNLVNTVKGYAAHEAGTLEKVTAARTMAMGANGLQQKAEAENQLTGALKSLFAVSESYPDLKANTNFLELQRELTDTENKIQAARRFYNTNVRDLNIAVESFPSNVVANMVKVSKREFFELGEGEEAAKQPVEVKF
jgi:LemA protein